MPKAAGKTKGTRKEPTIGRLIRQRRIGLGFSQEMLAQRLGITYQQVQKYENGKSEITVSRLEEIARHLGVSIQYFFRDSPPAARSIQDRPPEATIKVYRRLPDGRTQEIVDYVIESHRERTTTRRVVKPPRKTS